MTAQKPDTIWSRPARLAGRIVLLLAAVVALVLLEPYWAQLIIAGILVFLLQPLLAFFQRRLGLRRGWALALTVLALIAILAVLVVLVPAVTRSVANLSQELTGAAAEVALEVVDFLDNNREVTIQGVVIDLSPLVDALIDYVQRDPDPSPLEVMLSLFGDIVETLKLVTSMVSMLLTALLVLVFAIYMLVDMSWLRKSIEFVIPEGYLEELASLGRNLVTIWIAYIRGQLGVMLAVGVTTVIVALVLGLPYALALGLIAALLEIIPHIGPVLAAVAAVVVALFEGSSWIDVPPLALALIVIVAYILIQQLEEHVFTPTIQGRAVHLPPLVIILSVLVGLHEFGLLGAILAVPVVASTREILVYIHAKVNQQDPFLEEQAAQPKTNH
jgi:predicted PurR-regulated permease PerM